LPLALVGTVWAWSPVTLIEIGPKGLPSDWKTWPLMEYVGTLVGAGGWSVMVAEAVLLGSALLCAVITTHCVVEMLAGAV
jgi:hypothetical protein